MAYKNPNHFPAAFPGQCPACSDRIKEGDQIKKRRKDGAYVHVQCPNSDALNVTGEACSVCWLHHPEGACDR